MLTRLLLQGAKQGLKTNIGRSILGDAAVATAIGGGAAVLNTNDRKRELYNTMNPDGSYNFSITDRIFSPFTGINNDSMGSYTKGRLKSTADEASAGLNLTGDDAIKVLPGDTPTSLQNRIKRRSGIESQRDLNNLELEGATARYYLPEAVDERRLAQERRNDTLLREAQIRADAINARQENNLLTLQLAQMSDRADHRREKAAARSQLVAALVGSLGNLGDAFVSI